MKGLKTENESAEYKYQEERNTLESLKKVLFMLMGYAGQKAMAKEINLKEAQEPVMNLADIITDIFTAESLLLRVEKEGANPVSEAILKSFFHDASFRVYKNAMDFTGSIVDTNMFGALISSIKKLTKFPMQNTMALRRTIADKIIKDDAYSL